MVPGVRFRGLCVRYQGHLALEDVSLCVPQGTTAAVIGPNGSGKSTLLRAAIGLERPERGEVQLSGSAALVLQSTDVERSVPITVRDTVTLARYRTTGLFRRLTRADRRAVATAMERLAVVELADRQLHELSGGQRQRVLVAQGLAQEAEVLLLDEPVTGLDVVSREVILDVIAEERSAGRTVVVTTHHLDDARRCDQVLLLATSTVAVGPPDAVLQEAHLRRAFGGRFVQVGSQLIVDDPHHVH